MGGPASAAEDVPGDRRVSADRASLLGRNPLGGLERVGRRLRGPAAFAARRWRRRSERLDVPAHLAAAAERQPERFRVVGARERRMGLDVQFLGPTDPRAVASSLGRSRNLLLEKSELEL